MNEVTTNNATIAKEGGPVKSPGKVSGSPAASHLAIVGIGVVGLIWLATTSAAPAVIALLIAALIYQGIHKGAFASFVSWING